MEDDKESPDASPSEAGATRPLITIRSIILGLMGAIGVCAFTYFNDRILRQTFFIGNSFPASIYGLLIIFAFGINRWLKRWAFTGAELAVILTLTLAACCIPGSGLMRSFTTSLALPHFYQKTEPGWQKYNLVQQVPKKMLLDADYEDGRAVDAIVQGNQSIHGEFSIMDVPWAAWQQTLLFWIPLILTIWFALMMMCLIIHNQWSKHECLSYPLANFANELLPKDSSREPPLLRQRAFWIAASVLFMIYMNNYVHQWFPQNTVHFPTRLDFSPLVTGIDILSHPRARRLFIPAFYFIAIGVGYLLPRNISFSFGIGPYMWAILGGVFATYGLQLDQALDGGSPYFGLTPRSFHLFGANLGIFIMILYNGRHYLKQVFGRALGLIKQEDDQTIDPTIIAACRVFMGLVVLFVIQLIAAGIPWYLAVFYAAILVVCHAVMSRLIAETGLFYIQPFFFPCMMILGIFGTAAIGPKVILIMQIVSVVLLIDPRTAITPFMTNSLKLLEMRNVQLSRAVRWCVAAVVLGMGVALPVTLYHQYNRGSEIWEGWSDRAVPKMPFQNAVRIQQRLEARGIDTTEPSPGFVERITRISGNRTCMIALLTGLVAVILVSSARLRFTWWPIHPLLFVTWAAEPTRRIGASLLVGWVIKALVMKYGGNGMVNKVKPIIFGLMAGEIIAVITPSIIGFIYYLITGDSPKAFHILPQ